MGSDREQMLWSISGFLKNKGFKGKGTAYNRATDEKGIAHVVGIQFGVGSLQGLVTVDLGIFVAEAYYARSGSPVPRNIKEYECQVEYL